MSAHFRSSGPLGSSTAIGWMSRRDFRDACRKSQVFARYAGYREFLDERDGVFLGYAAAGASPQWRRVPFKCFERWSRLTGAAVDIDGLDIFAEHWRWRTANPGAPTAGRFGAPSAAEPCSPAAAGVQILAIRREIFESWCDDFASSGLLPVPTLDDYAAHVAERCLPCPKLSLRPAVNSA